MTRTERMASWDTVRVPDWLRSDTEESIVGTEWHQEAIGTLATMLRVVADRRGVTWGVCEQIQVLGLRKESGEEYSPRPDVMVLPPLTRAGRASTPPRSRRRCSSRKWR